MENAVLIFTETHAGNSTAPYTHSSPGDPITQFIGDMQPATTGGSENYYIPISTGKWNNNTKRYVTTSDGSSPREGVELVYGPAYDDATNGMVMYEGGHDLDGSGSTGSRCPTCIF